MKGEEDGRLLRKEYLRRFNLTKKSKLKGRNKILIANPWAVSLMRCGAGILGQRMSFKRSIEKKKSYENKQGTSSKE